MTPFIGHALATAVVLLHVAFVMFVVAGGFLAMRWRRIAYVHLPAVAWAIYVEWSGAICPLTPIENSLRAAAGLEAYTGDFVANYIFPVLYPDGLTRGAQLVIGAVVLVINVAAYAVLLRKRGSNTFAS
jgi:hypothetical protein